MGVVQSGTVPSTSKSEILTQRDPPKGYIYLNAEVASKIRVGILNTEAHKSWVLWALETSSADRIPL